MRCLEYSPSLPFSRQGVAALARPPVVSAPSSEWFLSSRNSCDGACSFWLPPPHPSVCQIYLRSFSLPLSVFFSLSPSSLFLPHSFLLSFSPLCPHPSTRLGCLTSALTLVHSFFTEQPECNFKICLVISFLS